MACRILAETFGGFPNYRNNLVIPPKEEEILMDKALVIIADWCMKILASEVQKEWVSIVVDNIKSLSRIGIKQTPRWLSGRFVEELAKHPLTIPQNRLMSFLFILIG